MSEPADPGKPLSWTFRAARDLLFLDGYYAEFGQRTADRVTAAVLAAARYLEEYPRIGVRGRRRGTRHRAVSGYPYTIVYRLRRKDVQILRVLHQSRRYFN